MMIKAVIFDLDGVIVSTDMYHYRAWKRLSEEEGIYFDYNINDRLRGISRMESLEVILEQSNKNYDYNEKIRLAERKNAHYISSLKTLSQSDILPGVIRILEELKENNIPIAIGSSSKNARYILEQIGLNNMFDFIADGNIIKQSKPHPEVFLIASEMLNISTEYCLVIEDAHVGVEAAIGAGMKVIGVGAAAAHKAVDLSLPSLEKLQIHELLSV